MVHRNQQIGAQRLDLGAEGSELLTVLPVATKVDDAPDQRMLQALAIHGSETGTGNVDDQGGVMHGLGLCKSYCRLLWRKAHAFVRFRDCQSSLFRR